MNDDNIWCQQICPLSKQLGPPPEAKALSYDSAGKFELLQPDQLNGVRSDLVLISREGRRLYCHRQVMILWSGFFLRALEQLEGPLDEAGRITFQLDELYEDVILLLTQVYPTALPQQQICNATWKRLLTVADKYDVPGVFARVEHWLLLQHPFTQVQNKISWAKAVLWTEVEKEIHAVVDEVAFLARYSHKMRAVLELVEFLAIVFSATYTQQEAKHRSAVHLVSDRLRQKIQRMVLATEDPIIQAGFIKHLT